MSVIEGPLHDTGDDSLETRQEVAAGMHFVYGPLSTSVCFYCGDPFPEYPVIQWAGHSANIFLHPDCAAQLALHLVSDWQKAKQAAKRRPKSDA